MRLRGGEVRKREKGRERDERDSKTKKCEFWNIHWIVVEGMDGWMEWMDICRWHLSYNRFSPVRCFVTCCVTYPPCAFTKSGGALSVVHL